MRSGNGSAPTCRRHADSGGGGARSCAGWSRPSCTCCAAAARGACLPRRLPAALDRDGAPDLLASARRSFPKLRHVFADGAYAGSKLQTALDSDWTLDLADRQTNGAGQRLPTPPAPLGGRTHARLAQPEPDSHILSAVSDGKLDRIFPRSLLASWACSSRMDSSNGNERQLRSGIRAFSCLSFCHGTTDILTFGFRRLSMTRSGIYGYRRSYSARSSTRVHELILMSGYNILFSSFQ